MFNFLDRVLKNIQLSNFIKNLFHGSQAENCALLGYYTSSSSNFLPTFRDNLLVPIIKGQESKKKVGCPNTEFT